MNVVLLGWCAGAPRYLEALLENDCAPQLVVTGAHATNLVERCRERGIPVAIRGRRQGNVNEPRFVQQLAELKPGLIIISGWPQMLREPFLRLAKVGIVNFHPSLLPDYRGRHPLYWAILQGESEVGITVHRVTADVDAGPVLYQRAVRVPDDATSKSLLELVDAEGARIVSELLRAAATGQLPAPRVSASPGSYFPAATREYGRIAWSTSAEDIERHRRACEGTIRPFAEFDGMRAFLLDARVAKDPPMGSVRYSEIMGFSGEGLEIAAGTGSVVVDRWMFLNRVVTGRSLAESLEIPPGGCFDGG